MLTEKKRKQRISSDPQNLNWRNDTNAFGKKMMEQMGWRDGNGLGRNGEGIRESVRQSVNYTQKGLGFNGGMPESNWASHDDEFSRILAKLNEKKVMKGSDRVKSPLNLEEDHFDSKMNSVINNRRKRSLSKLSSEQKTAIFGRTSKPVNKGDDKTPNSAENQLKIAETPFNENQTSSHVTMDVYFAKKNAFEATEGKRKNGHNKEKRNIITEKIECLN